MTPATADALQKILLWHPLITAVVAATTAIGTTWLAHSFTARRETEKDTATSAKERKAILRAQLERLVQLALRVEADAIARQRKIVDFAGAAALGAAQLPSLDVPADGIDAIDEANAIQSLYFPALADQMIALRNARLECDAFVVAELQRISRGAQAWLDEGRFNERASASRAAIIHAERALVERARALMNLNLPS